MDYSYLSLNSRNLKIYPLQMMALEKLKNNKYICIFDEVGVGKTIEGGLIIWDFVKNKANPNILIICPKTLTYNWYTELFMHFGFEFKIVEGVQGSIYYCDKRISNLLITSMDSGENEGILKIQSNSQEENGFVWDLIIIDEGHEALSQLRSGTLAKLRADKAVFMTATPIKNKIDELEKELEILNKITKDDFKMDEKEDLFHFNLKSRFNRNFKEIVKYVDEIKNNNGQIDENKIKERVIEIIPYEIKNNRESIIKHIKRKNSLDLYHDICNIAYFSQKGKDIRVIQKDDDKLKQCIKVIKDMQHDNLMNRAIIFCKRVETVSYLESALSEIFTNQVLGITSNTHEIGERKQILNLLGNKNNVSEYENIKVLIIIDSLAEVGLNLPTFNYAISYELPFTPAKLEQCFGRIDRLTSNFSQLKFIIFQENDKTIHLESRILNILYGKLFAEILEFIPSRNVLFSTAPAELEYGYYTYLRLNDKVVDAEIIKKEFDKNNNFEERYTILKESIEVDEKKENGAKSKIKSGIEKKFLVFLKMELKNSELEYVITNIKAKAGGIEDVQKKLKKSVLYRQPKDKSIYVKEIKEIINTIYEDSQYKKFENKIRENYIDKISEIEDIINNSTIEDIYKLREEIEMCSKNYFMLYSIYYSIWRIVNEKESIPFSNFLMEITKNEGEK